MAAMPAAVPTALAALRTEFEGLFNQFGAVDRQAPPEPFLSAAAASLAGLVSKDDWLPDAYRRPHPDHYQQFLLYRDPESRFSVVSFVWGPGQATPVHDHQVWGLVGVLQGAELAQRFAGAPPHPVGPVVRLEPGAVDILSPREGDIHRVENALKDRTSISIHVYGDDIGQVSRWVFPPDGAPKCFISGYSNDAAAPVFGSAR